jgi:hypothetical protein
MAEFRLEKWYFDCVSPDGDLAIVYRADLHFRALSVQYSSLVTYDEAGVATFSSFCASPQPRATAHAVACSLPGLQVEGQWSRAAPAFERELFASPRGSVSWECLIPAGEGEVTAFGSRKIRGLGYVERLTMTVPPWAMPIDELRWGRFIGVGKSIVWIDWRGPSPRRVVLEDGHAVQEASIDNEHVTIPASGLDLHIADFQVLREGAIGSTALSIFPKSLRDRFPGRIFRLRECKWRARGKLQRRGVTEATGWVIHEVVEWP